MTQRINPTPKLQALIDREPDLVDRIFEYLLSEFPQIAAHVTGFDTAVPAAPAPAPRAGSFKGPAVLGAEDIIPQTMAIRSNGADSALGLPVVTEAGEPQTLPSPASTPLALTLPVGTYEVVLVGPPPDSQEQRVSVRVEAQTAVAVPAVRFRPVTPEEYFEQYLAPPVEAPLSPAPVSPAPAVPTAAAGVSQ